MTPDEFAKIRKHDEVVDPDDMTLGDIDRRKLLAEATRLQRVVDDLRDGLENRRLRNRNARLEWILSYGRKQVETLVDRKVAAEADRDRFGSQIAEAKSIVERALQHGYDIGGAELDDLAVALGASREGSA